MLTMFLISFKIGPPIIHQLNLRLRETHRYLKVNLKVISQGLEVDIIKDGESTEELLQIIKKSGLMKIKQWNRSPVLMLN